MLNSHPGLSAAPGAQISPTANSRSQAVALLGPSSVTHPLDPSAGHLRPTAVMVPCRRRQQPGDLLFPRLPPFSGYGAVELTAGLQGGAWPEATPLTRPLRPPSAFSTVYSAPWEGRAPPRTRPSPLLVRQGRGGWEGHAPSTRLRLAPPLSNASFPNSPRAAWKGHASQTRPCASPAPLPQTSGFGLPHNAPRPALDPYIQSLLHTRMRQNLRGWQEKAAWSR